MKRQKQFLLRKYVLYMRNTIGKLFCVTTWGESHGKAIGAVIDGCPAGLDLSESDIQADLDKRAPGQSRYVSPRRECDHVEIFSGTFEGKTTGTPICLVIYNRDVDSSKYEPIKDLLRPSHAQASYLEKYGIFDYRGGGRASGRETACRVAAGAVAKKLLSSHGMQPRAYLKSIGGEENPQKFEELLDKMIEEGDSIGGVVEVVVDNVIAGLGEPLFLKMEALLAQAMLSLPATKGFEIGSGFSSSRMKGSEHNDLFITKNKTATNHSGGTLGGITTGMPLIFRVAFKPTSSIRKTQKSVKITGEDALFDLPAGSRHDPCVAIRAVPVVEAMASLILADTFLLNLSSKLCSTNPF